MLIGSFTHGVDAKGRIFIPSKWREDLGATIIVIHGIFDRSDTRCLFGMSEEAWKDFSAKFSSLPVTDTMGQAFRRMLFSNAADCELDKQGRILLPAALREYAGLSGDAVLVGVDNRIEIWSQERWEAHNHGMAENVNAMLLKLSDRGI